MICNDSYCMREFARIFEALAPARRRNQGDQEGPRNHPRHLRGGGRSCNNGGARKWRKSDAPAGAADTGAAEGTEGPTERRGDNGAAAEDVAATRRKEREWTKGEEAGAAWSRRRDIIGCILKMQSIYSVKIPTIPR
jgi:hypothetical protein